jgi:hypothetical protein
LLVGEDTPTSSISGALVRSVTKLASITFLSLSFSYWIYYLGFITEGKLVVVLITPSLGVPNWPVIYIINTASSTNFLAALPGRKKTSAWGVSHAQSFTLFFVLLYFIFACTFLSKNTKKLVSFIVAFIYLLLVLLEWVLLKTPSCVTLLAPKTMILSALLLRHLLLRQIFMRSNLLY